MDRRVIETPAGPSPGIRRGSRPSVSVQEEPETIEDVVEPYLIRSGWWSAPRAAGWPPRPPTAIWTHASAGRPRCGGGPGGPLGPERAVRWWPAPLRNLTPRAMTRSATLRRRELAAGDKWKVATIFVVLIVAVVVDSAPGTCSATTSPSTGGWTSWALGADRRHLPGPDNPVDADPPCRSGPRNGITIAQAQTDHPGAAEPGHALGVSEASVQPVGTNQSRSSARGVGAKADSISAPPP